MITAKTVADSKNRLGGSRITSMIVTFPRIILAENNTHKMVSKNSASSRAIPYRRMVETMFGESNLRFTPIAWQKDHSGMQGMEYFEDPKDIAEIQEIWDEAAKNALMSSEKLSVKGVTKQLCNRLLEPFMWHTVLVTATEWGNFFALRCPKYIFHDDKEEYCFRSKKDVIKHFGESEPVEYVSGNIPLKNLSDLEWLKLNKGQAEIHMMALAEAMWDAMNESTPKELNPGEWHIPFGDDMDFETLATNYGKDEANNMMIKVATARCARVSYTVVGEEGKVPNFDNDIKLHDRLAASGHWSPFEHCAEAMDEVALEYTVSARTLKLKQKGWLGNFRGFIQYRKKFENENITK